MLYHMTYTHLNISEPPNRPSAGCSAGSARHKALHSLARASFGSTDWAAREAVKSYGITYKPLHKIMPEHYMHVDR